MPIIFDRWLSQKNTSFFKNISPNLLADYPWDKVKIVRPRSAFNFWLKTIDAIKDLRSFRCKFEVTKQPFILTLKWKFWKIHLN